MLIHHELVKFYQSEARAPTHYEADWTTAYALVRSSRLVSAVTHQFGSLAGSVVSHILANGHTRVSELINLTDTLAGAQSEPLTKPVQTNGLSNGKRKLAQVSSANSEDSMHKAMHELLKIGYLTVLHESHLRPQADNITEAIWECKRKLQSQGVLKKADQAELDRAVRRLLQVWKSNEDGIRTQGSINHLKRQFEDADVNNYISEKKRRVNGGHAANDTIHLNVCLAIAKD